MVREGFTPRGEPRYENPYRSLHHLQAMAPCRRTLVRRSITKPARSHYTTTRPSVWMDMAKYLNFILIEVKFCGWGFVYSLTRRGEGFRRVTNLLAATHFEIASSHHHEPHLFDTKASIFESRSFTIPSNASLLAYASPADPVARNLYHCLDTLEGRT